MYRDYIGVYRTPNNRVLGPKHHEYHGIWALKLYYLGPWNLRGGYTEAEYPTSS